jgi:hypothetical protein
MSKENLEGQAQVLVLCEGTVATEQTVAGSLRLPSRLRGKTMHPVRPDPHAVLLHR